jgi:hypothetical protein
LSVTTTVTVNVAAGDVGLSVRVVEGEAPCPLDELKFRFGRF